ncbi:MAG: hypothetical protein ABI947_25080 [Chloroflexota bacterium]
MRAARFSRYAILLVLVAVAVCLSYTNTLAQEKQKYMLAVIGSDNNLSIYDADGKNPFPVTTDAKPPRSGYHWPTWSTDGRLAYFGVDAEAAKPYSLGVFVLDQVKAGVKPKMAYSSLDEAFTYAYWAPANCPGSKCRDLALLFTPSDGNGDLGLRLIRDNNGKFTDKEVGRAAPFFYSFSPDAKQMFWFRSGTEFGVYDVAANKVVKSLDDKPGQFAAPMWSPTDSRWLFGTAGDTDKKSNLVVAQGTTRQVLLPNQDNPLSFAWSPDSKLVASVSGFDKVVVTDAKTAKTVATSSQGKVVAHFWSPQSDRVAYLVIIRGDSGPQAFETRVRNNGHTVVEQATDGLVWHILDVKTGADTTLPDKFLPTQDMVYLLNFFDQFARSHSLWSPDGRYLTYASIDSFGQPNVIIADTHSGTTTRVGSGNLGIWSWH